MPDSREGKSEAMTPERAAEILEKAASRRGNTTESDECREVARWLKRLKRVEVMRNNFKGKEHNHVGIVPTTWNVSEVYALTDEGEGYAETK